MDREKDIGYYKDMEYEVVLRKKRGNFVLVVPDLCIVEKDEDLGKAYEKLESKKEEYFIEMIEDGFEEYIRKPEKTIISKQFRDKFGHNLALFGIKSLLVLIICFIGVSIVGNKVNNFENNVADRFLTLKDEIISKAPREIALKSLAIGDRLKNMSEERRSEIGLKLRDTIRELKPFAYEISLLFENDGGEKRLKESDTSVKEKKK